MYTFVLETGYSYVFGITCQIKHTEAESPNKLSSNITLVYNDRSICYLILQITWTESSLMARKSSWINITIFLI